MEEGGVWVDFFVGLRRILRGSFQSMKGMVPYACKAIKRICTKVLHHHPDHDLVPEVVFSFQASKNK